MRNKIIAKIFNLTVWQLEHFQVNSVLCNLHNYMFINNSRQFALFLSGRQNRTFERIEISLIFCSNDFLDIKMSFKWQIVRMNIVTWKSYYSIVAKCTFCIISSHHRYLFCSDAKTCKPKMICLSQIFRLNEKFASLVTNSHTLQIINFLNSSFETKLSQV